MSMLYTFIHPCLYFLTDPCINVYKKPCTLQITRCLYTPDVCIFLPTAAGIYVQIMQSVIIYIGAFLHILSSISCISKNIHISFFNVYFLLQSSFIYVLTMNSPCFYMWITSKSLLLYVS